MTSATDDRYKLNTAGQITRDGKHVGWLSGLTVTLAPYQLDDGRYGHNAARDYPHAQIATATDRPALWDTVNQLLTGAGSPT